MIPRRANLPPVRYVTEGLLRALHRKEVPHGRPPVLTLHLGDCGLDLPLRRFEERRAWA